jgi:uncharacterized membrane protein
MPKKTTKTSSSPKKSTKPKTTPSIKVSTVKKPTKKNPHAKETKVVVDFPPNPSAKNPTLWKGIVSLILGILSVLLSPLFIVSIPMALVALILGIFALPTKGKSLGIAGIITAFLGLLISIFMYAVLFQLSQMVIENIPSATPISRLP